MIRDIMRGVDLGRFRDDALRRSAVERQFIIVGEALAKLSKLDPETARRIPELSRIVGFRHRLVHGYDHVDAVVVWDAAQHHLPQRLLIVEELLENA